MPKVLVIAYYFPPLGGGGTLRTLKFVRYLPDFDWGPVVLTVKAGAYHVHDHTLSHQIPQSTPIVSMPAILPARFFRQAFHHHVEQGGSATLAGKIFLTCKKIFYTSAFIPDEFIGWYPFAVRAGLREIQARKVDVIFSTSPPNTCHVIARALKRRTGLPWIADLRDLWDMYPESYNPFGWQWRRRLDDWQEQRILREADRLIVVSHEMRAHLLRKLPELSSDRIHVITNGFDPDDYLDIQPARNNELFTIVHAGTLFSWRPLRPFLLALQRMLSHHPEWREHVRMKLLGLVPQADREEIAGLRLTGIVEILGHRSHHETLIHLRNANALLLLVGEIPHAPEMIPGKIFDYIGSGRSILAIGPEGSARRLVREEKLGADFHPDDVEGIAGVLELWLKQHRRGEIRMPEGDFTKFHRRELTRRLAEVFNQAL